MNFTHFFLLFLTRRLKIENDMRGLLYYISAGQHCPRGAFGHCCHLPLDLSVSLLEDSPHLVALVALFLAWDLQAQCRCCTGVPSTPVPVCSAPMTAPPRVFGCVWVRAKCRERPGSSPQPARNKAGA